MKRTRRRNEKKIPKNSFSTFSFEIVIFDTQCIRNNSNFILLTINSFNDFLKIEIKKKKRKKKKKRNDILLLLNRKDIR
jgi:hypothetical protein